MSSTAPCRPDEDAKQEATLRARLEQLEAEAVELRARLGDRSEAPAAPEVRRQHALLLSVLHDAPAAIAILEGPDHRYVLSNEQNERLTEGRVVLGEPLAELFPEAAEQGLVAMLDRVRATGETVSGIERPLSFGKHERFVNFFYRPLRGDNGGVDAVLSFFVDVTDEVVARRRAQAIAEVAAALSDAASAEAVANVVVERVHDVLGATASVVYVLVDGSAHASLAAARDLPSESRERLRQLPLDASLPLSRAISARQPVFLETRETLLAAYPVVAASAMPAEQLQAVAAIPLLQRGRVLGGIALSFAQPHRFDAAEQRFLLSLAGHCALALERAQFLESERRFRAVFDHALDAMVIVGDDRTFVDVNPAACELLRTTREQLVGRSSSEVMVPEVEAGPEQWTAFRSDRRQRGEIRLLRADGTSVQVEYAAAADILPGRHLAVWHDIEERRRGADILRFLADASAALGSSLDSQAALGAVARLGVPTMADWVAVDLVADDGRIRRVHVAHVDPTKVELAHELHRRYPSRLDDPEGVGKTIRTGVAALVPHITDEMLAAGISDPELLGVLRSLGLASWMCAPLVVRGRTIGAFSFIAAESRRRFGPADLTIAEEVAHRAGLAVENARSFREAQEANRLKDEFLSIVSHELRTPLTAMLGWASLLRGPRAGDPEALRRGLETIERNARAQGRLIEDVLDVSRIVSGKLRLQHAVVDLAAVVAAAVDVVTPMAAAKRVSLQAGSAEPLMVFGDADRLQQVVWNLLSNAVKFTPAGGDVRVSLELDGQEVVLRVADTGQGIRGEMLPFVFDRFRQADSSASRHHGGLGLGLAIARHLVELHGGVVFAESEGAGKGSRFTVRLPGKGAGVAASEAVPAREQESEAPSGVRLDGVRVLVCDDDADTRELLAVILGGAGADARTVPDATAALSVIAESQPQVLVSDIGLPGEDGYGLMRRVRALPADRGGLVPAVALTAYAREEDAAAAVSAGYDMHLPKPIRGGDLIAAVARLAGSARPPTP